MTEPATKVLTERLMGFLTDPDSPADLDSFLIITFTRAAAGELRGRIMEELASALAADPGNSRLRRQSALCRRAQIGTIHSFCAALLRENSHLAGLTPDFKIVDDDRARAIASAFWPGPLTLVLPLRDGAGVSPLVTAGLATVAIRVPAHPLARTLLRAVGRPVAAPSANPAGRVSPTRV